ncbi:MAG: PHP domain-containing protein, partial [Bacteroidales bacterium]|nr:PHP domain-containing protein [Bacteroidales bacterium]
MTEFAHLHVHTQYSILDGASSIPELIRKVKETGMKAIAITDHGNMFGVKEFHNEAKKQGIKPIIGCEVYVAVNNRFKKDEKEDRAGFHLILLAKNMKGYKNLIKMVSLAWIEGFYYKPRIDKELLRKYSEGIIACSACLGGELPSVIRNQKSEKAEDVIKEFVDIFGDDYYLELMRHETGDPEIDSDTFSRQVIVNKRLIELSEKFNIKLIATNDVHFINAEDAEAHDRLICLNTGKDLDDPDRLRYTKQEFLKTPQEMSEIFSDIPEALENTIEVVEKIDDYELNQKP